MELVLATKNKGKIREFKALLKDLNLKILSLNDFPEIPNIVEDGKSFRENAVKKAESVARMTNRLTLADDSGIEVDYLKGEPGIFSSRYTGIDATDKKNNKLLLEKLKDVKIGSRTAVFRCVLALANSQGVREIVEGECRGYIGFEEKGDRGFGYDPLFVLPDYKKTMAELDIEIKNRISHRANAVQKLIQILQTPGYYGKL